MKLKDMYEEITDFIVYHPALCKLLGAAGLTSVTILTLIALKSCIYDESIAEHSEYYGNKGISTTEMQSTEYFGIGEHIISVPIKKDIRYCNVQHEYFPGYEPIGIAINSFGKYSSNFGGGSIIYANTEEVECISHIVDENGKYLYLNFGTPVFFQEEENIQFGTTKVFNVGEHIISVPIYEDNRNNNIQYDYIEGYEVVGTATSTYGKYNGIFAGGVLLYKNTVPVECICENNGYTSFGKPINKGYSKKLN